MSAEYASIFAPGLFAGRVVIVTGGGSGIGRCTAHELAALGAQVVLIGRSVDKLQATATEIEHDGGRAGFFSCDIRQEEAVKATVAAIKAEHGRIDALVNNAGGQYLAALESISAKGWDAVVASNLSGGFLMARECYLQSMREHGGNIVNIVADMWGSMPSMGHSGAARAGMVSFTETAAADWAVSGVRVNAVAPGYTASSGMDRYPPEAGDMLRAMRKTVPMGRFGVEAIEAATPRGRARVARARAGTRRPAHHAAAADDAGLFCHEPGQRLAHRDWRDTRRTLRAARCPRLACASRRRRPVKASDALVVVESMKLEHSIAAPRDARIGVVAIELGQQVSPQQLLLSFEAA